MVGEHRRLHESQENILANGESEDLETNESKCCYVWHIVLVCLLGLLIAFICFVYLLYGTETVTDGSLWTEIDNEKVVSCYYNTPNPKEPNQLLPSNIHPFLCTHINVAFARVVNKEIYLDDSQYNALAEVVKLKHQNPKLKVLLSVGGSRNDDGFSEMVENHASRKIFIRSIKQILRNHSLDGIDLDWEFPGMSLDSSLNHRERQHFSQLLREIRVEYIREKRNYLLTIAAAAPETIVNVSYDIDQINTYVDYVNIMTYDFHYYTNFTPFTGHNSPLYARATEQLFLATLNINYTVHMYLRKGLDSRKIVVGIPTYGHSFKLVNVNNHNINSPASGYGNLGSNGFVSFPEICNFINRYKLGTTLRFDNAAKVPYLFRGLEWVSFDYPQSAAEKARYVVDNNLRGAMVYSLNADDYQGICGAIHKGDTKFPLLQSVKNTLNSTNSGRKTLKI